MLNEKKSGDEGAQGAKGEKGGAGDNGYEAIDVSLFFPIPCFFGRRPKKHCKGLAMDDIFGNVYGRLELHVGVKPVRF